MELSREEANAKSSKTGKVARRIATVVGIVICVILIPIFVCNLILTVKGYTNKDEVPSLFGISTMYVLTGSMEPTINKGDLVFVKKVPADEIVEDDVIAFFDPLSDNREMVAHRVAEIMIDDAGNIFFVTKGDFTGVMDKIAVSADNLVGKYVGRLPYMGRVAMFLQTTPGLVVSLGIPILMLFGYELIRQLVYIKREQTISAEIAQKGEKNQEITSKIEEIPKSSPKTQVKSKKSKKKSKKSSKGKKSTSKNKKVQVKIKKYK